MQQLMLGRAPQDDPRSLDALAVAWLAYMLADFVQAVFQAGSWPEALAMALVDSALVAGFCWAVLRLAGKRERLVQTLTALAGTGAILGVIGLPMLYQATRSQPVEAPSGITVLAWLILLTWNLAVQAHIYRHALSTRFGIGLLVAGLYTVVAMALLETGFPDPDNGENIH